MIRAIWAITRLLMRSARPFWRMKEYRKIMNQLKWLDDLERTLASSKTYTPFIKNIRSFKVIKPPIITKPKNMINLQQALKAYQKAQQKINIKDILGRFFDVNR